MIWLLFILIAILTYTNHKLSCGDLSNPAVVLTGMFAVFSFFCCIANLYIGIDIESEMTIFVILLGLLIFSFVNYILAVPHKQFTGNIEKTKIPICCGIVGLIVNLLLIYVNYIYIIEFAAAYGIVGDFSDAMVNYKVVTTLYDADAILIKSPWYRNGLIMLASVLSYFAMYIFMRRKILDDKWSLIYSCNILLYVMYSLMGGARSETFRVITALILMWYIFYREKKSCYLSVKYVLVRIAVLMSIVSFFFITYMYVVGRSKTDMDMEAVLIAMFIYAGAPIFNLDIYLQNPWTQTHGIFGELTFIRLINWLGIKLGDSSLVYALDLPFLSYRTYGLGNVYTTFYAFFYDFGIIGIVVLTIIMAVVCVWLYNKMNVVDVGAKKISMVVICYAYLLNDIIMLPFSNRFYESLVNVGTWYMWTFLFVFTKIVNVFQKIKP